MADEQKTPEQIAAEAAPPERPEWLPDQFKTGEDLAKSYDESRREMDRLRSELDNERKQFTEALQRLESQPPVQQQAYNPTQDPLIAEYGQAIESGDYARAVMIQAAISQQATAAVLDQKLDALKPALTAQDEAQRDVAFRLAEERVAAKFGERWTGELQPQVYQMLRDRPHWVPQAATVDGYASVLEEAASIIESGRIVAEQRAAEADRQAKLAAQGITGQGARPQITADEAVAEWEKIKNAPVSSYQNLIR